MNVQNIRLYHASSQYSFLVFPKARINACTNDHKERCVLYKWLKIAKINKIKKKPRRMPLFYFAYKLVKNYYYFTQKNWKHDIHCYVIQADAMILL